MFDELETYQGLVLRSIVTEANQAVSISPFKGNGRVNSFILDSALGVFVKYSTARVSPWRFTFHIDQAEELLDLEIAFPRSLAAFVCGPDGFAAIPVAQLHDLVTFKTSEQAWLRVVRRPRGMYFLSGNRAAADRGTARGAIAIVSSLLEAKKEQRERINP